MKTLTKRPRMKLLLPVKGPKYIVEKMKGIIKIDNAIYFVNDGFKTYRYSGRNPEWEKLSKERNEMDKKSIDGYIRIFKTGKRKKYQRTEHP